ncbi:NAD-dependent epimerase/dehydratase family protein, partial [Modestobacter roseus]
MSEQGSVLVTGAGGVIGAHAAAEYARRPGWRVRGVSRRTPREAGWEHLAVDLRDADAARDGLAAAADTTHLVFGAYAEQPTARELSEVNVGMLRHTLDGLATAGAPLEHVTLYQGGKAYGAHMGFFNTPAKETDP